MVEGNYIRDIHSLEELNNMIVLSGEAMANIEENVSNYIDGVQKVLEEQLEIIWAKLEEAQERLSEAEEALSSCELTQEYDEESGEYRPSCAWEERAVQSARAEVDKWQKKYDEGKRIVDECKGEIDDYNSPGSFLEPPGGHHLIINMSQKQTPYIVEQLREYIIEVYNVFQQDVGGDYRDVHEITNPNVRQEDIPLSKEKRYAKFRVNIQGLKEEQAYDAVLHKIKDANRAMHCPTCGRPFQLCICRNQHADAVFFEK